MNNKNNSPNELGTFRDIFSYEATDKISFNEKFSIGFLLVGRFCNTQNKQNENLFNVTATQ